MLRSLIVICHISRRSTNVRILQTSRRKKASWNFNNTTKRLHQTLPSKHGNSNKIIESIIDYSIIKTDPVVIGSTKNSNISLDDLEIQLDDEKFVLNLTWLRDFCYCSKCMHQYSRQKLFTFKDFCLDRFSIKEVKLISGYVDNSNTTESERIFIKWSDDHESSYSLSWLRYINELPSKSQIDLDGTSRKTFEFPQDDYYSPLDIDTVRPVEWGLATINTSLSIVDYSDLTDNFVTFETENTYINHNSVTKMTPKRFSALKNLTESLSTYGLAKIVNVPKQENQVLNVARCLAYERPTGYGRVFDVIVEPSDEINLAYSALEFDLHTDLPYRESSPGVQLLHCIRNSTEGGESYFSDGFKAADRLRNTFPELFEVLVQFPATFSVRDPYRNIKFRRQQPIIKLGYDGKLREINYSPFYLPPIGSKCDVKLFYLAIDKFTQFLQSPEQKLVTKMDPGDLFIFNNRRVLHGRSAYDASTSRRFLQGCYMDWDEIESLNEKLKQERFN